MEGKDLNRLKVVLAEKKRTNKWLAEQIGVDQATVSKWCTNSAQPNLENLIEVARCLEVNVNELLRMYYRTSIGQYKLMPSKKARR